MDFRWLNREAFVAFFDSDACIDRFRKRLGEFVNSLRNKLDNPESE